MKLANVLPSAALALLLCAPAAHAQGDPDDGLTDDDDSDGGDTDAKGGDGDGADSKPDTLPTPPPTAAASEGPDLDELRRRYLALRDRLFRSRARAATVASSLYSTRVRISLHYKSGRHHTVTRASVRLDGTSVFDDDGGAVASNKAPRFEGFVAPGRHRVTFRIEATGKDDERFSTATETTVAVQAVAGKDLVISADASDGGDIAYQWKKSEKGRYKLGLNVSVKATKAKSGKKNLKRSARR